MTNVGRWPPVGKMSNYMMSNCGVEILNRSSESDITVSLRDCVHSSDLANQPRSTGRRDIGRPLKMHIGL